MIIVFHEPGFIKPTFLSERQHALDVGFLIKIPKILVVKPYRRRAESIVVLKILFQLFLIDSVSVIFPRQLGIGNGFGDPIEGFHGRKMKMLLHHGRKSQHGKEAKQDEWGPVFLHFIFKIANV